MILISLLKNTFTSLNVFPIRHLIVLCTLLLAVGYMVGYTSKPIMSVVVPYTQEMVPQPKSQEDVVCDYGKYFGA